MRTHFSPYTPHIARAVRGATARVLRWTALTLTLALLTGCTIGGGWPGPSGYTLPPPPREPPPPPPPPPPGPRLEVRENRFPDGQLRTRWQVRIDLDGTIVRHGPLVRYHPNGLVAVTGRYRNGRATGLWRWYDERGDLMRTTLPQEDYEEVLTGRNLEDPRTVFRNPQGHKVAEGLRKYDQPHGDWTYYYPQGPVRAQGRYVNGLPDGHWVFYFRTGLVEREEDYKLGVPHGTVLRGWPNGQEQVEGQVEQGLRVGRWRTWHRNGQVESDGEFREDRQEGEWRYWDDQGRLVRHVRFRNGEVAAELPLPVPTVAPPPLIRQPELLPFRPRIYDEGGAEIRLEEK